MKSCLEAIANWHCKLVNLLVVFGSFLGFWCRVKLANLSNCLFVVGFPTQKDEGGTTTHIFH